VKRSAGDGAHANSNAFEDGMITAILNTNGGTVPDNCQR
jgi:hypothetical protein